LFGHSATSVIQVDMASTFHSSMPCLWCTLNLCLWHLQSHTTHHTTHHCPFLPPLLLPPGMLTLHERVLVAFTLNTYRCYLSHTPSCASTRYATHALPPRTPHVAFVPPPTFTDYGGDCCAFTAAGGTVLGDEHLGRHLPPRFPYSGSWAVAHASHRTGGGTVPTTARKRTCLRCRAHWWWRAILTYPTPTHLLQTARTHGWPAWRGRAFVL